jgi:class 3 adenylate cyclase/ubiquinone/menaquinone biosynthesis C-methylase UbiE
VARTETITILFTDIVGSTDLLAAAGEAQFDTMRREHFEVIRSTLAKHRGAEVKNTGDGFMATFSSAVDGARCAAEAVTVARRVVAAGRPVAIRVGVATGEAMADAGDWFGTPVVTAARLCAAARPNEALVTDLVRSLAQEESDLQFTDMGERALKGLTRPTNVHGVTVGGPRQTMYTDVDRFAQSQPTLIPMLDYWSSLPAIQQLHQDLADAVAVQPGHTVLDVGFGTGDELIRFARLVGPTGKAIGIEPSQVMQDEAHARAARAGVHLDLVTGDGRATGLPDASCDVVRIERVIQHIGDLAGFLAEAMRITKPGGAVALADTDWGSLIIHPGDPHLARRIKAQLEHGPMGEPWAGRKLHRGLMEAGFADVRSQPYAVLAGPGLRDAVRGVTSRMTGAGLAGDEEMETFTAALRAAELDGSLYYAFIMVLAVGRRP